MASPISHPRVSYTSTLFEDTCDLGVISRKPSSKRSSCTFNAITSTALVMSTLNSYRVADTQTEEYVNAIRQQIDSERTLYPAKIFEDLADFLDPTPARLVPSRKRRESNAQPARPISHAILYTFSKSASRERPDKKEFTDPQACADAIDTDEDSQASQILFLRGYSSCQWQLRIAATCQTDPEFLNSNMIYRCRESYFSYPSLPSSYENIVRLRISTIGMREQARGQEPNSCNIQRLRLDAEEQMKQYLSGLKAGFKDDHRVTLCDSIVRNYHVVDEKYFVVEQEISVCLHKFGKRWLAWVSQDSGNSLAEGLEGPWLSKSEQNAGLGTTRFHPIIQHGGRKWFQQDRHNTAKDPEQSHAHTDYPQTAALLPSAYGQSLDKRIMACDPLYALNDIFRLYASSENQLLRLLERAIARDIDYKSLTKEKPTLSNLLYYRGILTKHSEHLRDLMQWIKRYRQRHDVKLSIEDDDLRREAEGVTNNLLVDFEHLVRRTDSLSERCNNGMVVIGNNAMLLESRKAISQADQLGRLTFIAFIFAPLSFTTSLFGMNVAQLGTGPVPIGIWAAISCSILFVTTLGYFIDRAKVVSTCRFMRDLFTHFTVHWRRKPSNSGDSMA